MIHKQVTLIPPYHYPIIGYKHDLLNLNRNNLLCTLTTNYLSIAINDLLALKEKICNWAL